jgi:hypothetical protein
MTLASGHLRRNQRSRCRNPPGHVPGITGQVGPEYSHRISNASAEEFNSAIELIKANAVDFATSSTNGQEFCFIVESWT